MKNRRRIGAKLPEIIANFAMSVDGKISTRNHTPSTFTSASDKHRLLEIRALGDAVMAGRATVQADSMSMTLRDAALQRRREQEGRPPQPLRVIISASGRIPGNLKVFQTPGAEVLVFTTPEMPRRVRSELSGSGATIVAFEKFTMQKVLEFLANERGTQVIVCEGGATLFRSLLQEGLVTQLYLTIAPFLFGGNSAPRLTGASARTLDVPTSLQLQSMKQIGEECFLHYKRRTRRP